jgi:hypothetical protein
MHVHRERCLWIDVTEVVSRLYNREIARSNIPVIVFDKFDLHYSQ